MDGIAYLYPRHELLSGQAFGCGTLEYHNRGEGPRGGGKGNFGGAAELLALLMICAGAVRLTRRRIEFRTELCD
jgi:hypothetical protein